jgi:hypothetical protein
MYIVYLLCITKLYFNINLIQIQINIDIIHTFVFGGLLENNCLPIWLAEEESLSTVDIKKCFNYLYKI